MLLDEFDYQLPESAIAQEPLDDRSSARLLVDFDGRIDHRTIWDLPDLLGPGDVVVLNDTRVIPARLPARRPTGGLAEVLLLEPIDCGSDRWEALVRPSRKVPPGTLLTVGDRMAVRVLDDLGEGRRLVEVESADDLAAALDRYGRIPLPPYLTTALTDPERYQTVYSRRPASAAAPTAGLHFTDRVLDRCRAAGARVERLELVVGLDTFRPVAVDDLDDHRMYSEAYTVSQATLEACRRADRVVAVGTTTTRALEAAARTGLSGRTDQFIRRPFDFQVVDLLLTNFHLPRTTLLVMLDAFIGPYWRDRYDLALAEGYRFLSFGDAMLVDRHLHQPEASGMPVGESR